MFHTVEEPRSTFIPIFLAPPVIWVSSCFHNVVDIDYAAHTHTFSSPAARYPIWLTGTRENENRERPIVEVGNDLQWQRTYTVLKWHIISFVSTILQCTHPDIPWSVWCLDHLIVSIKSVWIEWAAAILIQYCSSVCVWNGNRVNNVTLA